MPILRKLLDLLLPGFNPAKIKRNEENLQAQPNPLHLANYFALRTIFAFAARYPTYESQGFEIKLRTEWVGSRRLWETLRFTRFRLSLSESDDTLTLEGRAEYHFRI